FLPARILRRTPSGIFSGRLCQIAGRQVMVIRSSQPFAALTARNSLASAPQAMNRVFGSSAMFRSDAFRVSTSGIFLSAESLGPRGVPGCYCRDRGLPESDANPVAYRLYLVAGGRRV